MAAGRTCRLIGVVFMFPFGFALGAVAGAAAVLIVGPEVVQRARPVAKAVLKAALTAMHEAQVHGAEIAEAAEDLYAEARAEVTAAAMAAAQARTAGQAAQAKAPRAAGAPPRTAKAARKRTAIRRSRTTPPANG